MKLSEVKMYMERDELRKDLLWIEIVVRSEFFDEDVLRYIKMVLDENEWI